MIDDNVRSIVRTLSETHGKDFFNTIVKALTSVIDADFAFVAELDNNRTNASMRSKVLPALMLLITMCAFIPTIFKPYSRMTSC